MDFQQRNTAIQQREHADHDTRCRSNTIDLLGVKLSSNGAVAAQPATDEPWNLSCWATEIKEAFARGASGTMSLARTLARAKAKLRHGDWTRLWRAEDMPFSKRKAEMLVVIGKTMGALNAHDCAHLPLAWHTLYILAALGRTLIEQLIAQGRIHPRLTFVDAKDLVLEFKPALTQRPTRPRIKQRISRFTDFVRRTLPNWSPEHCDLARSELSRLLIEIESLQPSRKS